MSAMCEKAKHLHFNSLTSWILSGRDQCLIIIPTQDEPLCMCACFTGAFDL